MTDRININSESTEVSIESFAAEKGISINQAKNVANRQKVVKGKYGEVFLTEAGDLQAALTRDIKEQSRKSEIRKLKNRAIAEEKKLAWTQFQERKLESSSSDTSTEKTKKVVASTTEEKSSVGNGVAGITAILAPALVFVFVSGAAILAKIFVENNY
jgi:hypothetical protein